MHTTPLNIMLVDDHAVVRTGMKALLENAGGMAIVAEAASGEQACEYFARLTPDVVVMDLSLPGIGGLEATRRITARDTGAKILVLSMHDDAAFVEKALQAGARGYISKNAAPAVMVEAVRKIGAGEAYLDHQLAQNLALRKASGQANILSRLTTREFEIFCLLAQGMSPQDTASELALSYKTVANYTTQIKAKLGISNTAELAHLAIKHGVVNAG